MRVLRKARKKKIKNHTQEKIRRKYFARHADKENSRLHWASE